MSWKCPCPKKQPVEDCCPSVSTPCRPTCQHDNHDAAKVLFERYPCTRNRNSDPRVHRGSSESSHPAKTVSFALDECNSSPCAGAGGSPNPRIDALMQSVRLQEIMMQTMRDQMLIHKQTFRAAIRPTQKTREVWEERNNCSGDVDTIEQMLCELGKELESTKQMYECLKRAEEEEEERKKEKEKKCICGKFGL